MWKGLSARLSFTVTGISTLATTPSGAAESLEGSAAFPQAVAAAD